ncbi:MAG: ribosome small subunit-dependent GTPase A [Actinomycetes bacterium]
MTRIDIDLIEEEWDDDFRPPPNRQYSVAARERIDADEVARVVQVDRGRVTVVLDGDVVEATYAGSMRGTKVAVGDRVRVRPRRHDSDTARITDVLDRDTVLRRTSDDRLDDARVLVANAEQVIVVIGADYLDGGVRFLDRVLVAAHAGGVDPVVCINKVDLGDPAAVEQVRARYADIGVPSLTTSAETGDGVEELRWRLEEAWTAFAGHSGVGKSSLMNLLVPGLDQTVAEVGRRGGRHTTVAARAEPVPGLDDAWLVDTPGVRSFGLGFLRPEELTRHVPELAGLGCAHDDCVHDGEPGCRIDEARIHPDRLASYWRLLSALRGDDRWERDEWGAAAEDEADDPEDDPEDG